MWFSEVRPCLSWGCWCDAFDGECCDISLAASADPTFRMLWHLFPTLWNDLVWESFKCWPETFTCCTARWYHTSVASVSMQLAAREPCAGIRLGLLQRQLQCNQLSPLRQEWVRGRGDFFPAAESCYYTSSPLHWILGMLLCRCAVTNICNPKTYGSFLRRSGMLTKASFLKFSGLACPFWGREYKEWPFCFWTW